MADEGTYKRFLILAYDQILLTERLQLVKVEAHHEQAFWEMFSDEEVMKTLPYDVETDREKFHNHFMDDLKNGLRFKFGFVAEYKDRPGDMAAWSIVRPTEDGRWIEIGYAVHQTEWGRGIATEITQRLVQFCQDDKKWPKQDLMAISTTNNPASQRVLEKSGFMVDEECEIEGKSCWIFKYVS